MSNGAAEVHNPIFAHWIFPRLSALAAARGGSENRQELLAGLSGRVIEIGAGNGLNFRHYPRSVSGGHGAGALLAFSGHRGREGGYGRGARGRWRCREPPHGGSLVRRRYRL